MSLGGNCSNLRNSMKEPFEFAMLLTFTLKSSRSHGSWCILFKRQGFFNQVYMQNVLSCLVGHYNKIYLNGQAIYNIARTSSCLSLCISIILLYFLQIHHPLTADGSRSTRGQRVHLQLWDTAGQER